LPISSTADKVNGLAIILVALLVGALRHRHP
jgi:hypothetical protein